MTTETQDAEIVPESQALAVRDPNTPPPIMTAAQARIDAVADLTKSALAQAGTLKLTPEETAALTADFPDDAFQTGAGGKESLIYIAHAALRDRLNTVLGLGQWAIIVRETWNENFRTKAGDDAVRVYSRAMLLVRGAYVGEAVGDMDYYPKSGMQNYGDAFEGSKTAAFRRCAKEFGVGLQAWRKDWCEGWWQRKRGQSDPRTTAQMRGAQSTPQAPKAAVAPSAATKQPVSAGPLPATAEQRTKFIAMIGPEHQQTAFQYFLQISALIDTESLEDLGLGYIPSTKSRAQELMGAISAFGSSNIAEKLPWMNPVSPAAPKAKPAPPAQKPVEVPRDKPGADAPDEWFMDVLVTVPHKGQKRDEYLKNPDTIGSLYSATKGGDEEAQRRLFGFVSHYEPKGWTNREGKEMPPNAGDVKFREALDAFSEWHDTKDESLPQADPSNRAMSEHDDDALPF